MSEKSGAKQQMICSRARELESQNLNFRSEFVHLDFAFEVMSHSEIESTIILDINLTVISTAFFSWDRNS